MHFRGSQSLGTTQKKLKEPPPQRMRSPHLLARLQAAEHELGVAPRNRQQFTQVHQLVEQVARVENQVPCKHESVFTRAAWMLRGCRGRGRCWTRRNTAARRRREASGADETSTAAGCLLTTILRMHLHLSLEICKDHLLCMFPCTIKGH